MQDDIKAPSDKPEDIANDAPEPAAAGSTVTPSDTSEPTSDSDSKKDGASATPETSTPAGMPALPAPKPKSKLPLIILLAIGLVGVAALAYFMLAAKKVTTTKTTNSTTAVKETGDIIIGINTDLTAPSTSAFGISSKQGVELAVEDINAKGGILGRKVRVVTYDDKADAETAKKNTEKLIKEDKVHAIVSPTHATNAAAWIDMAQDSETTVLIPAAPSTALTQKFAQRPRNYIFRINATDNIFAELEVAWAIKQTNNGKVAILAADTPYGQQGTKDLTEVLSRWGKTPVTTSKFAQGATTEAIRKNIDEIKAAGADAVIMHSIADDMAKALLAMSAAKYDPIVVGSSASLAAALPKGAGALASKVAFPTGVPADLNDKTKSLNDRLTAKNGTPTPVFAVAAQSYDGTTMILKSIEKAGGTSNRAAYRDALENITGFDGVIKNYGKPFTKTNHEGMQPKDLYLAHWVGAKVVPYKEETAKLEIR